MTSWVRGDKASSLRIRASRIVRVLTSGIVLAVTTLISSAVAAECVRAIGAVPSLQGEAQVQLASTGVSGPAALNEQLCPGDVIHVGERSRGGVTVVNQTNVRLDQNTALALGGDDQQLQVRLLYGAAYFFSRQPRRLVASA